MKLMIASDLHGSAFYCRQLLAAMEREQPDKLLLLGDILYHGPRNDLPKGYAPKEVIAMLNPLRERLLCVRGNCDTEVDQMVLDFPILADYALLYAGSRTVFATHGHHYNTACPRRNFITCRCCWPWMGGGFPNGMGTKAWSIYRRAIRRSRSLAVWPMPAGCKTPRTPAPLPSWPTASAGSACRKTTLFCRKVCFNGRGVPSGTPAQSPAFFHQHLLTLATLI